MRWREHPKRLRGVAVADENVPVAELRRWNDLGIRALRFNHFFRDGKLHYQGGVTLENAKKLAPAMKDLGWHMQLWIDVKDLPDTIPIIKSIGLPVVIDHMGRTDARAGINTPGFQSLVRLAGEGGCWVKMSGAHRLSTRAPDYPDARPFHEALVAANPDQLIWGTDWPHPRIEGEMPNAGHLLDLFNEWTPDESVRRKILVDNPARLTDFRIVCASCRACAGHPRLPTSSNRHARSDALLVQRTFGRVRTDLMRPRSGCQ